ncbi:hypothetical protein ABEV74_18550 [Paenibacillus cisolokensis]
MHKNKNRGQRKAGDERPSKAREAPLDHTPEVPGIDRRLNGPNRPAE